MKVLIIISVVALILLLVYYFVKDTTFFKKVFLGMDKEFKYFTLDEFDSVKGSKDISTQTYRKNGKTYLTDSGKNNISLSSVKMLDDARSIVEDYNKLNNDNIKFVITSGYRTPSRNEDVGGVKNSAHTKGYAFDIAWGNYNSKQKKVIEEALRKVGFNRVGIANGFIHVDNDKSLPQNKTWYYSKK